MTIMPAMTSDQEASWHGLMDLQEILPEGWTLVGGQMVHLHCAERGFDPTRPTPDIDAVLDVVGYPNILLEFTSKLEEIGFKAMPPTATGKQHRWMRGEASIDVLIPDSIGERSLARVGATGSQTVATPGAQQALTRSDLVEVVAGDRTGYVRRPNLVGALVCKAAAHSVPSDPRKGRHLSDFATLASMLTNRDLRDAKFSKSDKKYLRSMCAAVRKDPRSTQGNQLALDGLTRIETVIAGIKSSQEGDLDHAKSIPSRGGRAARGTSGPGTNSGSFTQRHHAEPDDALE